MKTLAKLAVWSGLIIAAGTGYGAVQQYYAYHSWITGATSLTTDTSGKTISPVTATVYSSVSAPTTFTAHPGTGLKTVQWYYATSAPTKPSLYTKANNTDDTIDISYGEYGGSTQNMKLAVEFDWINYTLDYEGGDSEELSYTEKTKIADCDQTRTGYTFANVWTNAAGTAFRVGASVSGKNFSIPNHDDEAVVTLYPKWTANTYAVALDAQGGTGGTTSLTATYDSEPSAIAPPTLTGYTFSGYFTQPSGKGKQIFTADGSPVAAWRETTVNTLYACWTVNRYTVTVSVEGDGTVSVDPAPSGGTYTNGQSVVLTAKPISEKATSFVGWSDGSTENPRTIVVTSNATYIAMFETRAFTVTWEDDTLFDSEVLKVDLVNYGEDSDPPDTPQHEGYKFQGWTQDGKDIRANTTITATYKANQYRVWMYRNDGSEEKKSYVYTYDTEGKLPANEFTRTGYTFKGWGTNVTSAVVWQDGARVWNWSTGTSVSLYAVWQPNAYTVRFEPGEGTGAMADQAFVYDVAQTLATNAFTNGELGFIHWSDSNGKTYTDGQTVSNLTTVAGDVVTLTAIWERTIHVAFDGNGATNENAMAVQDFASPDEAKPLSSNLFGRVGYTFTGWATNRADAAVGTVAYADGATAKFDVRPGSTVTLYAVWQANTYFIAFDPGQGQAREAIAVLQKAYDETPFPLPDVTDKFVSPNPDLYSFDCWRDDLNGTTYTNLAVVSNLCATANATNTLVATWKLDLGEWSTRLHCTNLRWRISSQRDGEPRWSRAGTVSQAGGSWNDKEWLEATVRTNGTLRFSCRNNTENAEQGDLEIGFVNDESFSSFDGHGLAATNVVMSQNWSTFDIRISFDEIRSQSEEAWTKVVIRLAVWEGSCVEIDNVEWIPDGIAPENPEPTAENRPTVTGLSFVNGKLVITATGDARFGYQVSTTDSLTAPIEWRVVDDSYQTGAAEGQTFELTLDPAESQRFYRVEVLKRR